MTYTFKAALVSAAEELLGFRFMSPEDDNIAVDVPISRMESLSKTSYSFESYKETLGSFAESGTGFILDRVTSVDFVSPVSEETILVDADLNAKEDRMPIKSQRHTYKVKTPTPDETQQALVNMNWFIYNTEFFNRFQVASIDAMDMENGNPSLAFKSYYSRKMVDTVYDTMLKFISDMGIKGLQVVVVADDTEATKKDQCSFVLTANLAELDFGTMHVSGYQMHLCKSGRAMISKNGNSVVVDDHGISFSQPDGMDLYDQPDVDVEVIKDLDPYQKPASQFMRFYQDLDGNLHILDGVKDIPPRTLLVANWHVVPEMKVNGEILDMIRTDDEASLPTVTILDDKKTQVTLRIPVDYSLLPADIEEVQTQITEDFEVNKIYDLSTPKLKDYKMMIASGTATPVGEEAIDFSAVLLQL